MIRIAHASPDDSHVLASLHAQCFADKWGAEAFVELFRSGNIIALISHTAEAAVPSGFIFVRVAADEAEVLSIGVTPAARGLGIGGALMRAAADEAYAKGAASMFLEVSVGNASAGALYRGLGFSDVGRRRGYYRNCESVADALVLRRALPISAWESRDNSTSLPPQGLADS